VLQPTKEAQNDGEDLSEFDMATSKSVEGLTPRLPLTYELHSHPCAIFVPI
jgi:hypothetical protein